MNRHAVLDMVNDVHALFAARRRRVLALPVESLVVYPVVQIAVIGGLALFVDGDQQHNRLFAS